MKPEILENETAAALSDSAWRVYHSMVVLADDHGRLTAHPRQLAAAIYWAHDSRPDVELLLGELETARLVRLYRVDESQYAELLRWRLDQRVDNAGKERVPPPPPQDSTTLGKLPQEYEGCGKSRPSAAGPPTNDQLPPTNDTDQRTPGSASPPVLALVPIVQVSTKAELEKAYEAYPRKVGKSDGIKRLTKDVRTPAQLVALHKAIGNYAEQMRLDATEEKYIKHFSTFVSEWKDWVDHAPKSTTAPARSASQPRAVAPHSAFTTGDSTDG